MNHFIDKIVEKDTILKEWSISLRNRRKPLIMYGAGCWAKQQYQMLKEQGVSIDAVGIDSKYYKKKYNPSSSSLQITPMHFFGLDSTSIKHL